MSVPVTPTHTNSGATGTAKDVFGAIEAKFKEYVRREYKNLALTLTDKTVVYDTTINPIEYGSIETFLVLNNMSFSIGNPASFEDMMRKLNALDIGLFYTDDPYDSITVKGFLLYGSITQNGGDVFSPISTVEGTNKATITDILRFIALRVNHGNLTAEDLPPLFTASVDNTLADPVLSFTLVQQAAHAVFIGPESGADLAPTFRPLESSDVPHALMPNDLDAIGYKGVVKTYEYDIEAQFTYTGDFWVVVNNNYQYIGRPASVGALVTSLNLLSLGTFTATSSTLITVEGTHVYGIMFELPLVESVTPPVSADIAVSTVYQETLPILYGSSAFDFSVLSSIEGDAQLDTNIGSMGLSYIGWCQGAVVNWMHYVDPPGDGYNFNPYDAINFGVDPCGIQSGIGCTTFGRDFFDEFANMMQDSGVTKAVLSVNVAAPLYEFTSGLINWTTIDIGSVIDEINIALDKANDFDFEVIGFELGMELTLGNWKELFVNTGGAEHGEDVFTKLLTHTNGSSAISIINHIRSAAPYAFISVDSTMWEAYPGLYPDWTEAVANLDVDALRQYYQFYANTVTDYQSARARIAEYPTFFSFITADRYNGKKTFISQFEIKASSPIASRIAASLTIVEFYITMHKQNIEYGNILLGITDFNLHKIFDWKNHHEPKNRFYYFQMLGELFVEGSKIIDVTFDDVIQANTVSIAVLQGTTIKVGLLNPTGNLYLMSTMSIDGEFFIDYTMHQRYTGDPMGTEDFSADQTGGTLAIRPYSFSIIERAGIVAVVNFTVGKLGLHASFTNNDGGATWFWDFGDGYTSILENPEHVYETAGTYIASLTIDGTSSGTQAVTVTAGMQPLFGVTINNIGDLVNDGDINGVRSDLVATIGYKYQAFAVGSDGHWMHYASKTGYPSQSLNPPTVGFGANLDEIFFFTESTSGAYDQHSDYNDTEVNFFEATVAYAKATGKPIFFQINIAHGSLAETVQFFDYMESQNVPFIIIYGGEQSIGFTSTDNPGESQSVAEYITKVTQFDDYFTEHYPGFRRIVNAAHHNTANWNNNTLASFALSRGINQFTQYAWIGDLQGNPNSNLVIADYFEEAIYVLRNSVESGNNSIYGDIVPRITGYASTFAGMKMHLGQYGVSLQRSGYVAQTIMHALLVWNEFFEFFKFNDANGGFIYSGTFLNEDEAAVQQVGSADNGWIIDNEFKMTVGPDTYAIRTPGMAYRMLNDLVSVDTVPAFIHVTRTGFPENFDIVAFKINTRILLYIYNFGDQRIMSEIYPDNNPASPVTGNCSRETIWSSQLYGSIGFNPSHSHFANNGSNVGLAKVNVSYLDETIPAQDIIIKEHSITKIELTSISNASDIAFEFDSGIVITTNNAAPVLDTLWTGSLEDVWTTSNNVYIDVYGSVMWPNIQALGFKNLLYGGGAQMQSLKYLTFDTIIFYAGLPGEVRHGNNYNGTHKFWHHPQVLATPTEGATVDHTAILDNLNSMILGGGVSFFPLAVKMCKDLGAGIVLTYNAPRQGSTSGFKAALTYCDDQGVEVKGVVFGSENVNPNQFRNKYDWYEVTELPDEDDEVDADLDAGGVNYSTALAAFRTDILAFRPSLHITKDGDDAFEALTGPEYKAKWFEHTADAPADSAEVYKMDFHIVEEIFNPAGTGADWLATVEEAFDTVFPEHLQLQVETYPDQDIFLFEVGVAKGGNKLAWEGKFVSLIFLAKYYKFIIEYNRDNNDRISHAIFYRLSTLGLNTTVNGLPKPKIDFYALSLIGGLFSIGSISVVDTEISLANTEAITVIAGSNVAMLIINKGATEYDIPSITVDGAFITPTSVMACYATSLTATTVTYEAVTTIKPYSITLVKKIGS